MALIDEQICKVMAEVGAVGKTETNQVQRYKYRGIDAVMNALHPALVKHHVFVAPEVISHEREQYARKNAKGEDSMLIYSVVTVKYHFYADDGSEVTAVVMGEAMDSGDKSMNKAMSAAYKYALFQLLCLPTEEMKDSEQDSPEPTRRIGKDPQEVAKESYPSRDEMQAAIAEHYADDMENYQKMLKWAKAESLNDFTDAQIMTVYNKVKK